MKNSGIKAASLLLASFLLLGCETQWTGQAPIQKISTYTKPIQPQWKGTFQLGNGIYASNDFDGGRLNGIVLTNDTLLSALITPENTPINESPWYSFKIWSETKRSIFLKLAYLEGEKHRYYPKLSKDGLHWKTLDSTNYSEDGLSKNDHGRILPDNITMRLSIGPDTLWISAQELNTSKHVFAWIDELTDKPFTTVTEIGQSREGKPIKMISIGNSDDKKMIMVISRQHPPEVTGYLAMRSFVETINGESATAEKFRNEFNTYVIPLVNPDGVDNGHWRHNNGGIDLNRDWENFNQPEVALIRDFMIKKCSDAGGKFYCGIDFHSTWEDIYYTIDPELKGNMPGLIPDMIEAMRRELPNYQPNIRPRSCDDAQVSSLSYFFNEFGAESLTFELGDNTPRDLLKEKGEVAAMKLMELMVE